MLCFNQSHLSFAAEIQELWKLGEPGDELDHSALFLCDKPSLKQYLLVSNLNLNLLWCGLSLGFLDLKGEIMQFS